jgi:PAS domain S-box-containing protein
MSMIENLSQEQLAGILEALPLDISFVDGDDLVRFWNRHESRVFKRPRSVLGKSVLDCHPKHSLDKVNQIISDFKSGKRSSAEFWIDHQGMKLYIRYFAVRDESGRYLGTLEAAQDITAIKALRGEKRLLDG